jgi:RNA polymerase sigma-70 factor (ECF subfamily)
LAQETLPSDEVLIPKLLDGDEAAFAQVVRAYNGIMRHVAKSIAGESIADEVTQEAWVAVIRALPKFERRSSLKTWILRIVSNMAKSRLRHESRTISMEDAGGNNDGMIDPSHFKSNGMWQSPPHVWDADTPEEIVSSKQLRVCIDNTMKSLPPLQQAVIVLRDMQGMDMDAICKILDVSESNGRVLLHRARSQLREAIDRFQRDK